MSRAQFPADYAAVTDYLYALKARGGKFGIDRMRLLCSDGTLESCTMEAEGEPAFYDTHHLSFGFARYVGKRLASVYRRELRAAGFPDPQDSH